MCRPVCALLVAVLILGGCTRQEATARLNNDIPVDTLQIIHARFPCRWPDLHFFGYRFRVTVRGIRSTRRLLELFNSTMDLANFAGVSPLAP